MVFVIVSGSGRWKRFWSQPNISKTQIGRPCVNGDLIGGTHGYRMGISPTPTFSLAPKHGADKSPFGTAGKRLKIGEKCQQSMFGKTFSGSEFIPRIIVQFSPKPQMSECTSNKICAVVERPDHRCGDDLVFRRRRNNLIFSLQLKIFHGWPTAPDSLQISRKWRISYFRSAANGIGVSMSSYVSVAIARYPLNRVWNCWHFWKIAIMLLDEANALSAVIVIESESDMRTETKISSLN